MSPPKKKIKLGEKGEPCQTTYDFSKLPYDVLINIFKYLDFKTVAHCATLCRTFYKISNEGILYNKVAFKHNMDKNLFDNYISKITCPKHLSIEYKFFNNELEDEDDYIEFESYVVMFLKRSGTFLTSIHFESCRNDCILSLISECPSLTAVSFARCKGTFQSLLALKNLEKIEFLCTVVPKNVIHDTLQNNPQLKTIFISDSSINANDICENLAKYNPLVEEVHISEKKRVRAKGLKTLARCSKLRCLELVGGPYNCDPEDSLEHLAAGCPLLERLALYGWKDVNDENLMPVLHSCTQLKELDLRGIDITIKSCREAALSLPFLQTLDIYKCNRIKKAQILKLQKEFQEIRITH